MLKISLSKRLKRFFCSLKGHYWQTIRIGHGKTRQENGIFRTKMYWHWQCVECGLYSCNGRFKKYKEL